MSKSQGEPKADTTTGAQGPEPSDTAEDVVRRLLDAESGSSSSFRPVSRKPAESGTASGKGPDKPGIVEQLSATPKRMLRDIWKRAQTAVMSYRPEPRHIALLLLAIIVLSMPWLIPVLLLLGLIILLISYLTLGHDRASELVSSWHGWLARRDPQGAETIRSRAERVSTRLSTWAQYLPDRWTSGLYLPDFSPPDETEEKLADDPFNRLVADPQNR